MQKVRLALVVLILQSGLIFGQADRSVLNRIFETASLRYSVPADVIKAVAYANSRFIAPDIDHQSCTGMPHSYGIMGLRDDSWFGRSAVVAANLLGVTVEAVKSNEELNLLGATAYLSKIATELKIDRANPNAWKQVVEAYGGIPQEDVKPFYSFDIFKVMNEGCSLYGVSIAANPTVDMSVFPDRVYPRSGTPQQKSDDYGPAVWDPSPNYNSGSITQNFSVVHSTEGGFAGSLSWLKNPAASASSHYIIRSSDGYIVQLVREANKAWHVSCWNGNMLGVEHEGYVANPAYFTEAMLVASAGLFKSFKTKYNIPANRNRVIAHGEWQNTAWTSWMSTNFPSISTTCNTHTDPGTGWDWSFFMQMVSGDTTAPKITDRVPAATVDSVWPNQVIKIKFDQRMKRTEAQNSFTIVPSANGSFTWEDNGRTLVFTPSTPFQLSTQYTVSLATSAINFNTIPLRSAFSFSFVTKSSAVLNVIGAYPANGQQNVSNWVKVRTTFNTPLLQSSLAGRVIFKDANGANVAMRSATYSEQDGKGTVSFSPLNKLADNAVYTVTFASTLQSITGAQLGSDYTYQFTTTTTNFVSGTVFDNLEAIGNWKQPSYSGSTVGTDLTLSTFALSTEEKMAGSNSGKLSYTFTGATGGLCRVFNATKPSVGSADDNKVGVWLYGDLSNNIVELWFYYNATSNLIEVVDTLNFTGWKFYEYPLSAIGGSGERLFHSLVVRQTNTGARSGAIYIDEMQTRTGATGTGKDNIAITGYSLEQNYPNPFNPSTQFRYSVPERSEISLQVFDVLGREVATLFKGERNTGTYSVTFNASDYGLQSGVYFYRLVTPLGAITKKLTLTK